MDHETPSADQLEPPEPPFDLTGAVAKFFRRHRLLRIWLIFVSIIALTAAVHELATDFINTGLTTATARLTAFSLRLLGEQAHTDGTLLIASPCTFEIIGECTAYYPCGVFIAAVMAYPCRLRARLIGVALGIPTLVLTNQIRLITLCYAYKVSRADFETLHIVVWQSLMMFLTFFFWIVWASVLARRSGLPN